MNLRPPVTVAFHKNDHLSMWYIFAGNCVIYLLSKFHDYLVLDIRMSEIISTWLKSCTITKVMACTHCAGPGLEVVEGLGRAQ